MPGYEIEKAGGDPDASVPDDLLPVDSEVFHLPNGGTVIGRDAYEAEMTRQVFRGH